MDERTCAHCGATFEQSDPRQRYCTVQCRKRAVDRRRRPRANRPWLQRCIDCGASFRAVSKRLRCETCKPLRSAPMLLALETIVPWASCIHCRGWFVARRGRICHTPECRHQLTYEPVPKTCSRCGVAGPGMKRQGRWCCPPCKRLAKRESKRAAPRSHRERARRFGVPYEPIKVRDIYERDGWQCYLCLRELERNPTRWWDDLAPTIDHVRPMSRGGGHLYENVRAACWECNTKKGEMSAGEYLTIGQRWTTRWVGTSEDGKLHRMHSSAEWLHPPTWEDIRAAKVRAA